MKCFCCSSPMYLIEKNVTDEYQNKKYTIERVPMYKCIQCDTETFAKPSLFQQRLEKCAKLGLRTLDYFEHQIQTI